VLRSARCFASDDRSVAVDIRRDCEPRGVGAAVEGEEAFSSFTDSTDTLGRFFWSLLPLLLAFHRELSRMVDESISRSDESTVTLHGHDEELAIIRTLSLPEEHEWYTGQTDTDIGEYGIKADAHPFGQSMGYRSRVGRSECAEMTCLGGILRGTTWIEPTTDHHSYT